MAVTQKQIADRLGISQRSVSGALSNNNRIGPELKARVLNMAREMGYRAHSAARATKTGNNLSLGLIFHSQQHFFSRDLLKMVAEETEQSGMNLLVAMVPGEQLHSLKTPLEAKMFTEHCVDGFLVNTARQMPAALLASIREQNIPAVWIETVAEYDCVYADEYGGGRRAVEILHELGHRRIDFATFMSPAIIYESAEFLGTHVDIDREAGYRQAMLELGLQPKIRAGNYSSKFFQPELDQGQRLRWATELLHDAAERPTALVCRGSMEAAPLFAAALKLDLEVPGDLSIVCLADEVPNLVGRPISTLITPFAAVGREAVRMLTERIKHPDHPLPSIGIPYETISGDTIAPPRADQQPASGTGWTSPRCSRYSVSLESVAIPVYETPEAAIVRPLLTGPGQLMVGAGTKVGKAVVRPLARGIQPKIDPAGVALTIPGPGWYALEINDDLKYPLLILADRPVAPPTGEGVVSLGPGCHQAADLDLRDGQTLYLDHQAWIRGGLRLKGLNNVRILGTGVIDGIFPDQNSESRLVIEDCQNIEVVGPTLIGHEKWSCIVRRSEDVKLERLKVVGSGKCSDGIDIDGSSRVRVENCFVKSDDDCLCIKATPKAEGRSVEDVEFADCILWKGPSGNGIEMGYESQCESFREIAFRRITLLHAMDKPDGAWADRQAALSIHITHDAAVRNVLYEDIVVEDCRTPKAIQFTTFHYYREHGWFSPADRLARGSIGEVRLRNVQFLAVRHPRIHIEGFNSPADIASVSFRNVTFEGVQAQDFPGLVFEKANAANFSWE